MEQRRANVVDVLSSSNAVAVLRPEDDVAALLWMGGAELNQAGSRKKSLLRSKMFSSNRVEVLNQQPDRFAAQFGKNMPFVGEMLINHGVCIADLFSDRAKRHGLVTTIGKHFAGSRKAAVPVRLMKRDLFFILEKLVNLIEEQRRDYRIASIR